jgi:transcriptional regulator PpsR
MHATTLKLTERQAAALTGETTLKVLSASSDLTLLIDDQGIIREVSAGDGSPRLKVAQDWIGRRWSDIVSGESRPKVEVMLKEARERGASAARHVNHTHPDGISIPLLYSAVELDSTDAVLALARDMSPLAQMQQRLVGAQQALERDYARLMELERRYRTLFQVTSNGVLMVDATSGEILEANAAAVEMLAPGALKIAGRRFPEGFDRAGVQVLSTAMDAARAGGAVQDVPTKLAASGRGCRVSLHLFHEAGAALLLVRLVLSSEAAEAPGGRATLFADCLQGAAEAFVTVGPDSRIVHANNAFVAMAQAASEEAVRRQPLDRYLGRGQVDMEVLLSALEGGPRLRNFATTLRGENGAVAEVEISAVRLGDRSAAGFFIHDVARRLPVGGSGAQAPERAAEMVGRAPLKDIVGETSDAIEELCIRRALELTGDNRAAAAELLGLSRQTLYAKLKKFGMDEEDLPAV